MGIGGRWPRYVVGREPQTQRAFALNFYSLAATFMSDSRIKSENAVVVIGSNFSSYVHSRLNLV